MKSILVALDNTPAALAARATALAIAAKHAARVAGIGVLDRAYLSAPEPVPLGASHYKEHADLQRIERARAELAKRVEAFEAECRRRSIACLGIAADGEPKVAIADAVQRHDLLVIGRDTSFHDEESGEITGTVEYLLKQNPRPLLVTPADAGRLSPILVAYDGSVAAARALQLFALLDLAAGARVELVSVQPTEDEARAVAARGAAYLDLYGIAAHLHPVATTADPGETLLAQAASVGAAVVVMGAFGHRGWREALLGSTTRTLLRECSASLFVHH